MSDLTVKLNWNGGLRFTGVNAGGIETAIDGDSQSGASPVELLLEALGACARGEFGAVAFSSFEAFHVVVGDGIWGAVGLAGLRVAPWAVRAGGPRLVAAGGSAVAVAVMAPGVPQLVNSVTGAGPAHSAKSSTRPSSAKRRIHRSRYSCGVAPP